MTNAANPRADVWRLEEAKARFSALVRAARDSGPQHVTLRGQPAVVVLSAEAYARLAPAAATSLADLFGAGPFARLDAFAPERDQPAQRDAASF